MAKNPFTREVVQRVKGAGRTIKANCRLTEAEYERLTLIAEQLDQTLAETMRAALVYYVANEPRAKRAAHVVHLSEM